MEISSVAYRKRNPIGAELRVERLLALKGLELDEPITLAISTPNAVTKVAVRKVVDVNREKGIAVLEVLVPLEHIRPESHW